MQKCSNTSISYALKSLLSKNWFYFFFSSSDMQKFDHLLGCHAIGINSSLIFFFSALDFLNLLCLAKSQIIIIVSGSSSSKLLSRLILLRFTLRIPISLQQNVTSPEPSSKKSEPSSAYKAYKVF